MLHCSLISCPFALQRAFPSPSEPRRSLCARCLLIFGHIHSRLRVRCGTPRLWYVFGPTALFSYFLNLLFSYHFSVPAAPTSALIQLRFIYAAPTLPGTCQFDPCVVLQQRLAEAAEMGNIYRAVRWGRALFLLHSHSSRQSRLQHPQQHVGAAVLVRTDAATTHAKLKHLHDVRYTRRDLHYTHPARVNPEGRRKACWFRFRISWPVTCTSVLIRVGMRFPWSFLIAPRCCCAWCMLLMPLCYSAAQCCHSELKPHHLSGIPLWAVFLSHRWGGGVWYSFPATSKHLNIIRECRHETPNLLSLCYFCK